MRRHQRIVFGLCVVAMLFAAPIASHATSVYSMNFLGERLESGDARAIALGGATQLVLDSLAVVHLNPALLARLAKVTIGVTQFIGFDEGRSEEFQERDISVIFSALRLAFPIYGKVTLGLGYRGRYDPDGSFSDRQITSVGDPFTSTFEKTGGLFSVPISLSFDLTKYASVGLVYGLERGFIRERRDIVFDDPAFVPSAGFKKEEFSGNSYGGGLVLHPSESVMIGGMFESAIDYDTDVQERFTQSALDTTYTSTAELPSRFAVGATWNIANTVLLLGSASFSDFKEFKGLAFPTDGLDTEETYAFGIEHLDGVSIFGKRFPVRGSFAYEKLPYTFPTGQQVNKYVFALGTGIPIRNGKLDVAIQFGKVGSLKDNTIEDRLLRVYVGLSGGEVWKRKGERDL